MAEARELTRHALLLRGLVHRDLTVRYKRSALGFLWTMLHPLILVAIMTIVFSTIFRFDLPHYPIYFLSQYVGWAFFSQTIVQSMTSMQWNGTIMKQIRVPKSVFVIASTAAGAVHMMLALLAVIVIMLITGAPIRPAILFLPVSILLLAVFTLGLSMIASAVSVFFADVREMIQAFLPAVMYLTPIIYPLSIIPEHWVWLVRANPLLYLLQLLRAPLYYGRLPDMDVILISIAAAAISFVAGWLAFSRLSSRFHPYL